MQVSSFSEIEEEFLERVHSMVWCSAATLDTRNRLRSRILHPLWEGNTAWVGTRRHSLKAKHLAHNPYMSLAYIADVAKPVYVDCTARWEDDLAVKKRIWEKFKHTPPPLGFDFGTIFSSAEDAEFNRRSRDMNSVRPFPCPERPG
ncbi:MAG: pyridoxamine 5'-phosphate oxidase family protein [Blastocatellia bacterium]|nr:pyridoxamine 5'-phosphate oxidase family protein [Blastocatellia bacterium]